MKTFLIFVLLLSTTSYAQVIGRVVSIADGDSFEIINEKKQKVKIRLHGIDAPEKQQEFGLTAKIYLRSLIYNKKVKVEYKGRDKYGRTIGIVYVEKLNINEKMLQEGMAWHFKKYDKNTEWAALEKKAKKEKKGLWVKKSPVAPWDWRKRKKIAEL